RALDDRAAPALGDVRPLGHRRALDEHPLPDEPADRLHLRRPRRRRRDHGARLQRIRRLGRRHGPDARGLPLQRRLPVLRPEPQVRQPQRDARQGRRADVPPPADGLIDIRELTDADVARIGDRLPLARLSGRGTHLVAWDGGEPVTQAHISWAETKLGVPEIQDVFVREDRRRRGLGTAVTLAAERIVHARGNRRISLGTSVDNHAARRLYDKLGYRDSGVEPERVYGTIMIRSGPLEVDDTLIYL